MLDRTNTNRAALLWCSAVVAGCVEAKVISLVFDQGAAVTVAAGTSHTFSVTMEATDPTPLEVEWDATCGQVMGAIRRATYVAPDAPGECVVTATSLFDRTKVARLVVTVVLGAAPGSVLWTRQFGSEHHDWIRRIAVDGEGHTYVTGETQADLDGPALGDTDVFVRKFDVDGTLAWARHFGTFSRDGTNGIALDAAGNVYVSGTAGAALAGSHGGGSDAFLRKYDNDGTALWTRQWGTPEDDTAQGVAVDPDGRVWVAGWTQGSLEGANGGGPDAFVRVFDGEGEVLWTRQLGGDGFEYALGVAPDGNGGAVVSGNTTGAVTGASAGGIDWFVRRFDAEGNTGWTRQFGAATDDRAYAMASRPGGGVVVGGAYGNTAFLTALGGDGATAWEKTFGPAEETLVQDVATNASGRIVVVGMTAGALTGENFGFFDAFVRVFDADGEVRWSRQFGSAADDYAWGAAIGATGHVVFGGRTDGVFQGRWFGGSDAFVRRLAP